MIDVVFTLIWRTLIVAGAFKRAPPEILRNILFFILMSLALALSLGQRGMLTTFSSAAILGGLAFVLGPGASSQVGNLSSALALQVERQFAVGDWIEVAGRLGRVENISWSSTYLFDDQFRRTVVIPNAVVDREYLVNYSRPEVGDYKVEVRLGLPYEMPPGVALELLREVLEGHDAIPDPQNHDAILNAFSDSSIEYVLRFFIRDFSEAQAGSLGCDGSDLVCRAPCGVFDSFPDRGSAHECIVGKDLADHTTARPRPQPVVLSADPPVGLPAGG